MHPHAWPLLPLGNLTGEWSLETSANSGPWIQYLEKLPGVEIVTGCDLFVPGSYDAAFAGCVGVWDPTALFGSAAPFD